MALIISEAVFIYVEHSYLLSYAFRSRAELMHLKQELVIMLMLVTSSLIAYFFQSYSMSRTSSSTFSPLRNIYVSLLNDFKS